MRKLGAWVLTGLLIVIGFALYAAAGEAGRDFANRLSSQPGQQIGNGDQVAAGLAQSARELNADRGKMMDSSMRFDSATAGPGRTIAYFNTLTIAELTRADSSRVYNEYRAGLAASACRLMGQSLRRGAKAIYVYSNMKGERILSFTVSQSDCLAP